MSQFLPSAAELAEAIARVLDDVLGEVPDHRRHEVRVAASLAHILERELRLGDAPDTDTSDTSDEAAVWDALVAATRRDLAITKPGYDAWEQG